MNYKQKLEKKFEEYDKRPHIDYRIIAFQLALDYHKLDAKYRKLEKIFTQYRLLHEENNTELQSHRISRARGEDKADHL